MSGTECPHCKVTIDWGSINDHKEKCRVHIEKLIKEGDEYCKPCFESCPREYLEVDCLHNFLNCKTFCASCSLRGEINKCDIECPCTQDEKDEIEKLREKLLNEAIDHDLDSW